MSENKKEESVELDCRNDQITDNEESGPEDEKQMRFSIVDILTATKPKWVDLSDRFTINSLCPFKREFLNYSFLRILARDESNSDKPCNLSLGKTESFPNPLNLPSFPPPGSIPGNQFDHNRWLCSIIGAGMPLNAWMPWFNSDRLSGSIIEQLRQQSQLQAGESRSVNWTKGKLHRDEHAAFFLCRLPFFLQNKECDVNSPVFFRIISW